MTGTRHLSGVLTAVKFCRSRVENGYARFVQIGPDPVRIDDQPCFQMWSEVPWFGRKRLTCNWAAFSTPGRQTTIENRSLIAKPQIIERQKDSGRRSHPILAKVNDYARLVCDTKFFEC